MFAHPARAHRRVFRGWSCAGGRRSQGGKRKKAERQNAEREREGGERTKGPAQSAALSPFERVTRRETPGARQALPPQRPATGRKDPGPHNGTWSPRAPYSGEGGVKKQDFVAGRRAHFCGPRVAGRAVFLTRAKEPPRNKTSKQDF